MKVPVTILTCLALLFPVAATAQEPPARDPEAIRILEEVDAALAEAETLEFDFARTGTYGSIGRTTGHAIIRRADSVNGVRYRATVEIHVPPAGLGSLGQRAELAADGESVWLLDHESGALRVGSAAGGSGRLRMPAGQFLLPLMFRPLQGVEIDQPEVISLAGTAVVDGVECDVIYLDFPDDTSFGEQYFYVGREDRLPRRIEFVSAGASPAQFSFEMTDLEVVDAPAEAFRLEAPAGYTVDDSALRVAPGAIAPDWTLTTTDGRSVSLSELRGKVVVMDFWASWCPICRNQLPQLSEVAERMEGLPVEFLAVNFMENGDPLAFLEEIGADLPVVLDGNDLGAEYQVPGTATIVLIGPDGRFRPRLFGAPGVPSLEQAIRDLLPDSGVTSGVSSDR